MAGDDMAGYDVDWLETSEIDEEHLAIPANLGTLTSAITVLPARG